MSQTCTVLYPLATTNLIYLTSVFYTPNTLNVKALDRQNWKFEEKKAKI